MELIINYTVQAKDHHQDDFEILDLSRVFSLSPSLLHRSNIEEMIARWAQQKQTELGDGEKVIVLSTLFR